MVKILFTWFVLFVPSIYVSFLGFQASQRGMQVNDVVWFRLGEGVFLLGLGIAAALTITTIDKIRDYKQTQKRMRKVFII